MIALRESWHELEDTERAHAFANMQKGDARDFFLSLKAPDQVDLLAQLPRKEWGLWLRQLAPDDLADLVQEAEDNMRNELLVQLDANTLKEVTALLAYGEDEAGGLMNPRFARMRPEMTVDAAIRYLRRQASGVETTRYVYVLDPKQKLLGVVSLRGLFSANGDTLISTLMRQAVVTANETMSQEEISGLFSQTALNAIPVVDSDGCMKGIVTVDDIVDVVEEEATEDIQRLGGTEVLDAPYLQIDLPSMIRKRAGWLVILFVGEMLTANAMSYFAQELEKAVVLALFIPLIISSGGNSGSQASTLVVRAIALREIRLRDWITVFLRETIVGLSLGAILGGIGMVRILMWPNTSAVYGIHYYTIAVTVAVSLVGVVLWGSLAGSMLPFILKRLKLDPATSSAPAVATLVDVVGLVIYFTTASILLKGKLL